MTFLLVILTASVFAQDKIIKKNNDVIHCKVTEIASDEVKYHYPDNPKLVFGIDKALVDKIEFGTGEVVEVISNTFRNPEYYANQNTNAIKFNFLSPLLGVSEFTYEKNIRPGRSWETSLGLIGLGLDQYDHNPRGVYGKFAYKFMRNPDFYMHKMHYAHILKGSYIAPEIAIRIMSFDTERDYYNGANYRVTNERKDNFAMALMLKFGKQWVFDDAFLVDMYWGVGYGLGGDDYEILNYGFIVGDEEVPIAFTGGIRIGWTY